jgi:transmembrane sensor
MKKLIPVELLEKYLSGKCSAREEAFVKEWYQSFEQDVYHIDSLNEADTLELQEKVYNRVLSNIEAAKIEENPIRTIGNRNTGLWYKVAVMAALAVTVTAALLYKGNDLPKNKTAAVSDTAPAIISVTNNSKHILKSVLPDSSAVWLSPNATLKYPKVFAKASRMVSMTGECFFEVTKNPKRPFIITGRSIITKVWGTSFLIRDNDKSHSADVSVVTGKVSVSIKAKSLNNNLLQVNKDEVILYPHQKAVYLADENILKPITAQNTPELKKWDHADLNFDNKPLKDIVPILNATYNVRIKIGEEKLNHYLLNADFTDLNLPDVLEALSKALNIDYALKNNTIVLNKPIN